MDNVRIYLDTDRYCRYSHPRKVGAADNITLDEDKRIVDMVKIRTIKYRMNIEKYENMRQDICGDDKYVKQNVINRDSERDDDSTSIQYNGTPTPSVIGRGKQLQSGVHDCMSVETRVNIKSIKERQSHLVSGGRNFWDACFGEEGNAISMVSRQLNAL